MSIHVYGTGWVPDPQDSRDFTRDHEEVRGLLRKTRVRDHPVELPAECDLRQWCPPILDQGHLNSCSAHATLGAVEYAERRARGSSVLRSRLFLYKSTRNLMKIKGDHGAYLRAAMKALVLIGAPPEDYWPYDPSLVDAEPPAFLYALAADYKAMRYYRHDPPGTPKQTLLDGVKQHLHAGIPAFFGALLFESVMTTMRTGAIALPDPSEKFLGAHAMLAVGYDDHFEMQNRASPGDPARNTTRGAFLIRNSWGTGWGDKGYGWIPYDYLLRDLATDWWSILHEAWVDQDVFDSPQGSSGAQ